MFFVIRSTSTSLDFSKSAEAVNSNSYSPQTLYRNKQLGLDRPQTNTVQGLSRPYPGSVQGVSRPCLALAFRSAILAPPGIYKLLRYQPYVEKMLQRLDYQYYKLPPLGFWQLHLYDRYPAQAFMRRTVGTRSLPELAGTSTQAKRITCLRQKCRCCSAFLIISDFCAYCELGVDLLVVLLVEELYQSTRYYRTHRNYPPTFCDRLKI